MPSKQQEFYTQLKAETEAKVQTYNEFAEQIKQIKRNSAERIKSLKQDRKFIAKQIEANNRKLKEEGQEIVQFTP